MVDKWVKVTSLLCLYGFLKDFKPSEPFLTEFLIGPWKNFTENQVNKDIYPIWTYSYLMLLPLVFLLTDICCYKPVIVMNGLSYVITYSLLIGTSSLTMMQVMQFFYSVATATEVAYFTYLYAHVDKVHYKLVTGWSRASLLLGKFLGCVVAQVTVHFGLLDYGSLNYLTLTSVTMAAIVIVPLPSVPSSEYFYSLDPEKCVKEETSWKTRARAAVAKIITDVKFAYSNSSVVKWSLWWSMSTCGSYQIGNYVQVLWQDISPLEMDEERFNGLVFGFSTLLGALTSLGFGYLSCPWDIYGDVIIAILSIIQGALVFTMAMATKLWVSYSCYVAFKIFFQMLITIAGHQVAESIRSNSYGLIFGLNTFFALILQTMLTLAFVDQTGIPLSVPYQFVAYAGYFFIIGIFFLLSSLVLFVRRTCSHQQRDNIEVEAEIEKLNQPLPAS